MGAVVLLEVFSNKARHKNALTIRRKPSLRFDLNNKPHFIAIKRSANLMKRSARSMNSHGCN